MSEMASGLVNLRPLRRFASKTRSNVVALGDEKSAEGVCDDERAEKTRGLRGRRRREGTGNDEG